MRQVGQPAGQPLCRALLHCHAHCRRLPELAGVTPQDAPLRQRAIDAPPQRVHPEAEVDDGDAALGLRDLDVEAKRIERFATAMRRCTAARESGGAGTPPSAVVASSPNGTRSLSAAPAPSSR